MYIRLFDVENNRVAPSVHCFTIFWLKELMEQYPDNYLKIFAYLQYMCSWNPADNPYLAVKEEDREEAILQDIVADFSTEDDLIIEALEKCKALFELPAYRAWQSSKMSLQALTDYQRNTKAKDGKDGNIAQLMALIEKLPSLNKQFSEAYKTYMEEAQIETRGGKFNSLV